jgi:hypothetical protein
MGRFFYKGVKMSKKMFSLILVLLSILLVIPTSVAAAGQEKMAVCHITGVYDFGSGPVPIGHVITIAKPAYQSHIDHGDLEIWQMRSLPNGRMVCTACTDPLDTDDDGDGYTENQGDCNDNNINVNPGATEVCNDIDDDCDGEIDEGVKNTYYQDSDGDTYGNPLVSTEACTAPPGYVSDNTDCDDTDANVHPEATEVCNGIDDDCNGEIDDCSGDPIVRVYFDCTEYISGEYIAHFSYSSTQNITILWGPDNLLSNFEKPIENFEVGFHLDAMQVPFDGKLYWWVTSNGVTAEARADDQHICISPP